MPVFEWLQTAWTNDVQPMLSQHLLTIATALLILIGGWLIAYIVRQAIFAAAPMFTATMNR